MPPSVVSSASSPDPMTAKDRAAIAALLALSFTGAYARAEDVPTPLHSYPVTQPGDDAEEGSNGQVDTTNDDLDLGQPSGFESAVAVGIRFDGLNITKRSTMNTAYIQFTKDEPGTKSDPANLSQHHSNRHQGRGRRHQRCGSEHQGQKKPCRSSVGWANARGSHSRFRSVRRAQVADESAFPDHAAVR
jgi:hypothetical protein